MLRILVLGAAAGGGFPQWNGNDAAARRARAGDPDTLPCTQSSLAVSADGQRWVILDASPDLRQQISERRVLHPPAEGPLRASPIAAVLATSADVDHVAGLLNLREKQPFVLYAHARVLDVLARNSIFNVLDPACVERRALPLDRPLLLTDSEGTSLGIEVMAFVVPGKIALWLEDPQAAEFGSQPGDVIGLRLAAESGGDACFFIPGCAAMNDGLARRLEGAALVFFDGTLWRDDEMIRLGVGTKTGTRMGHMSCFGSEGTIAAFADLNVTRKIFIHINNTNPLLVAGSPERAAAREAGWEVAFDGMEIRL